MNDEESLEVRGIANATRMRGTLTLLNSIGLAVVLWILREAILCRLDRNRDGVPKSCWDRREAC